MASGLMMLRSSVVFVEDHAAGSMLNSAGDRDAAVVFDFHRYRKSTSEAVRYLMQERVAIVAIPDGSRSRSGSLRQFDARSCSYRAHDCGVGTGHDGEAVASIDHTKAAWTATDTFLMDAQ